MLWRDLVGIALAGVCATVVSILYWTTDAGTADTVFLRSEVPTAPQALGEVVATTGGHSETIGEWADRGLPASASTAQSPSAPSPPLPPPTSPPSTRTESLPPAAEAAAGDADQDPASARQSSAAGWCAWVFAGRTPGKFGLYGPAIVSMMEGLEGFGVDVDMADGRQSCEVLANATACLQQGRRVLIIAIGWFTVFKKKTRHLDDDCGYRKIIRSLADEGAYVVLFNTEPEEQYFHQALEVSQEVGGREVWTYSHAHMDYYRQNASVLLPRYVPPGCAEFLKVGVDIDSPASSLEDVGFIGNWMGRDVALKARFVKAIEHHLRFGHANNHSEWRRYLEHTPLQFNMHGKGNQIWAFEALRAAMIAINYGCLLSQHANPGDEVEWDGIVHFGHPNTLARQYKALHNNSATVRECRQNAHDLFCAKFIPKDILARSGFVEEVLERWTGKGS